MTPSYVTGNSVWSLLRVIYAEPPNMLYKTDSDWPVSFFIFDSLGDMKKMRKFVFFFCFLVISLLAHLM